MTLTERDREILKALTVKVRVLALEQIASAWWPETDSGRRNARRRLEEFAASGLVARTRVHARPLLSLEGPVFRWNPGEPGPDCGRLSWRLQSRWDKPPQTITVFYATRKAVNRFGGVARGKIKNLSQLSHDVHVGAIYLLFLRTQPLLGTAWMGEDVLAPARKHQKLPDAVLCDDAQNPLRAIEFGGAYPPERLAAFHEDCARRKLPYEIW
jgi:hypothetical protein